MLARAWILFRTFPSLARACAVCFGQSDNPRIPRAFTWGIFILLGFTFAILAGMTYAIWRIEARRKRMGS